MLLQERRKAAGEGLRFSRLTGAAIKDSHWDAFYRFYRNTTGAWARAGWAGWDGCGAACLPANCLRNTACRLSTDPAPPPLLPPAADRKWGTPYLTRQFFSQLGERMADRVLLVLAEDGDGTPVAGALNLIGSHALFGRNWGCVYGDRVPNLHFEVRVGGPWAGGGLEERRSWGQ